MTEQWLHGWKREQATAYVGNTTRCAGCGKITGVFTVIVEEGIEYPEEPDWPFEADTCPVHNRPTDSKPEWQKYKDSFTEFVRRTRDPR